MWSGNKLGPLTCQDTKLRKLRFQLQRKLRQSATKGNEFSARVSVSKISCPDFRKTLRKSLQMYFNIRSCRSRLNIVNEAETVNEHCYELFRADFKEASIY